MTSSEQLKASETIEEAIQVLERLAAETAANNTWPSEPADPKCAKCAAKTKQAVSQTVFVLDRANCRSVGQASCFLKRSGGRLKTLRVEVHWPAIPATAKSPALNGGPFRGLPRQYPTGCAVTGRFIFNTPSFGHVPTASSFGSSATLQSIS